MAICPSQFAAQEITEFSGIDRDRVCVVPNGVSSVFGQAEPLGDAERQHAGVAGRYVLHVGGATARKNLRALSAAWREVTSVLPDMSLVLAGPPDRRRDEAFAGVPRVVMVGYCPEAKTARLMAGATLVVVPSVYEGFGLPAIEGMAASSPVVAARAGALPEVCGDAAYLVGPDATSIADAIVRVAEDTALRQELIARGLRRAAQFTWRRAAEGHLDAYDRAFS
jgi:alpha-1,3-rhamnosyl/mannosyltransferase